MSGDAVDAHAVRAAIATLDPAGTPAAWLADLVRQGLDRLPMPGGGRTLERWRSLSAVAEWDLSLAKYYEGHTDARAILRELGRDDLALADGRRWGVWAAEPPGGRVIVERNRVGGVIVRGTKRWCSGAADLDHALLTAWWADGSGPQLVAVPLAQPGVQVGHERWVAVGMARSASLDVRLDAATGEAIGKPRDYLDRPGFWHGGAGIAACWFGGARRLARHLHGRYAGRAQDAAADTLGLAALGRVDVTMGTTAALLEVCAQWIDDHPRSDAQPAAMRVRLAAERCATEVLRDVGECLGATPYCHDAGFARMAADLPVFVRQSHGPRDLAALGALRSQDAAPWLL